MSRDIKIGYLLAFVFELYLPIAVWLLFFLQYMDFTQVAILGAISTISANIFEIPTGAISDIIGRKWTMFISFVLSAFGLFILTTGNVFFVFVIGRIINGLAVSLFSGTHESFMYDTLKASGDVSKFDLVTSRVEMYTWIGLFISAIAGGFIYDVWPAGPFIISAVIYIAAAVLCIFLNEPPIDSETFSFKAYAKQNLQGFSELFNSRKMTQITLIMVTISAGYFFASKILGIAQAEQYGLTGKGIGMLFGAGYIIAAVISRYYPELRSRFGNTTLIIIASLMLLSSLIFAPFTGIILGSFLITARITSSTTFGNAKSVIMNRYIASKNRATALSTLTLLSQIPYTLTFYLMGKYIDAHSPNDFAFLLGIILLVLLIPQFIFARKTLLVK